MIKPEDIQALAKRSRGKCENPECNNQGQEIHHIYSKQQYNRADRDELWNLALLCIDCHKEGKYSIHARKPGTRKNPFLDIYLKTLADKLKPKELRSKDKAPILIRLAKIRHNIYKQKIDSYRAMHNGLTPSKVAYRKQKEYKKNLS